MWVDPDDLEDDFSKEWHAKRLKDSDGSLAREMEQELRDGDPKLEGIIWPHIAEISLMGGLGCGSALLEGMIDEMERDENSPYGDRRSERAKREKERER